MTNSPRIVRRTSYTDRAEEDLAAFLHQMRTCPRSCRYPRWQDSEAQRLLKIDIEAVIGTSSLLHTQQLWRSRQEYQAFPLNVFRKLLHQETQAEIEKSYWLFHKKKVNDEKKKQKV
jgi:hypothetical protein